MAVTEEPPRSAKARAAAELALVRVIHQYGGTPSFVLLGGLVPALLCAGAPWRHAGTTDVDVQVDLEIAAGSHDAPRLERALRAAGFAPTEDKAWRWVTSTAGGSKAEVKFELLADLDDHPSGVPVVFDGCEHLGAANLRGTGYAARDVVLHDLIADDDGVIRQAQVAMSGLAGFLLAKLAAAAGRRKPKDWYDIAFVLLHNDAGGVEVAARLVTDKFPTAADGEARTWLLDAQANFADSSAQGTAAYVEQMLLDHPDQDAAQLAGDAQLAISEFCRLLRPSS